MLAQRARNAERGRDHGGCSADQSDESLPVEDASKNPKRMPGDDGRWKLVEGELDRRGHKARCRIANMHASGRRRLDEPLARDWLRYGEYDVARALDSPDETCMGVNALSARCQQAHCDLVRFPRLTNDESELRVSPRDGECDVGRRRVDEGANAAA